MNRRLFKRMGSGSRLLMLLILSITHMACDSSAPISADEGNNNHIQANLASATAICIHAPNATCAIWNACYDCRAHRLLRGTLEGGSCGNIFFENACHGQISEMAHASDSNEKYFFVNMCVFEELKTACQRQSTDSVDICEVSTISTLNGCSVRGFSMDCVNQSVWTCNNDNLLLDPHNTTPPETWNVEVGP